MITATTTIPSISIYQKLKEGLVKIQNDQTGSWTKQMTSIKNVYNKKEVIDGCDKMKKVNERILKIEKKMEEQTESLNGMRLVLEKKGSNTQNKELLNIVFEMKKNLDELEKLKVALE